MNMVMSKEKSAKTEKPKIEKSKNVTKERQSNFECLRIVAMLMITTYHIVLYSGIFEIGAYTYNKLLAYFLYPLGKIGVGCFIILMGYFMVTSKFKIEKILKIVLETFFYSAICIFLWSYRMNYSINLITDVSTYFTPTISIKYWFISFYVFVYFISPLLNVILNNLTVDKLKKIIILGLILICVPYCIFGKRFMANDTTYFIFLYLLGGTLRISNFNFKTKKQSVFMAIINFAIITIIMVATILINKVFNTDIDPLRFGYEYSIFIIMASVGLFLTFKNIKMKSNKVINFISKSMLAVYLFSDHQLYKSVLWDIDFKMKEYLFKPVYIFGIRILFALFMIFIFAIILDTLRREILEKNLFKIKILNKICTKFNSYIND